MRRGRRAVRRRARAGARPGRGAGRRRSTPRPPRPTHRPRRRAAEHEARPVSVPAGPTRSPSATSTSWNATSSVSASAIAAVRHPRGNGSTPAAVTSTSRSSRSGAGVPGAASATTTRGPEPGLPSRSAASRPGHGPTRAAPAAPWRRRSRRPDAVERARHRRAAALGEDRERIDLRLGEAREGPSRPPSRPAPPTGGRCPLPATAGRGSRPGGFRRSCAATGHCAGAAAAAPAFGGVAGRDTFQAAGPSGWPGGWCAWVRSGSVEDTHLRIHRVAGQPTEAASRSHDEAGPRDRAAGVSPCVHGAAHPPPPGRVSCHIPSYTAPAARSSSVEAARMPSGGGPDSSASPGCPVPRGRAGPWPAAPGRARVRRAGRCGSGARSTPSVRRLQHVVRAGDRALGSGRGSADRSRPTGPR